MEFLTRVLSGNSRLKERAREAEQINQAFKESLDNLRGLLESEESSDVSALLDMVYESSFPEEQIFMKIPSRARLKSKKELLVRLLIGLDALGVATMAEMLLFVRKHGMEGIAQSLMTLLELLSPLLEGKEAPEFTTDDVLDAMDFEWHSTSRTGSPLLNVIASATSSPRASAASVGDSPLHPIGTGSPYRRAFSDHAMLLSRRHELGTKSVLDKTSTFMLPHRPTLTMSASSSQYPSADQQFSSRLHEIPASPEIINLPSINEKPPSYSLDNLPASSEHGLQQRHRRKTSSLRELLAEDTIDEMSGEGSIGASSKRNSSSSSWRRNSSDFLKFSTNVSGPSSPFNFGLVTSDSRGGGASDKEILSSFQTLDRQVNRSRRGSHRISPSPPADEVAFWREDSDGFTVDLVSNNNNPARNSVSSPIHQKSLGDIHETEKHSDGVEAAPFSEDAVKSKKSTLDQDGILRSAARSSLGNKIPDDSPGIVLQPPQDISSGKGHDLRLGNQLSDSKEPSFEGDLHQAGKLSFQEDFDYAINVKRGESAKHDSAQYSFEAEGSHMYLQDLNEACDHRNEAHEQDAYEDYGDCSLEAINLVQSNDDVLATQQECIEAECNKDEHVCADSVFDDDQNVGRVDAYVASPHENTDSSSESDELERSSADYSTSSKLSHWSSSAQGAQFNGTDCNAPIKNQLKKHTFEGASDKFLQIDQSCINVLHHGHHRSQSDLTPGRSLFKAESLMQQQKLNGSQSDCHDEMDIVRRRFVKRFKSLTASMESLMVREGSPDRMVMQESMPWMHVKEGTQGKSENENHERGSASESGFSSEEGTSTSSSSNRADDIGFKAPSEDENPLVLHELGAQILPSNYGDNQPPVHELRSQCTRDADFEDDASHAHALDEENITHDEEEAGHACSLYNHEEDDKHAHPLDNPQQNESEITSESDKISPMGSNQEGIGFQWRSSSLLPPSLSNVSLAVDDQPAKKHEQESLQQGDIEAEKPPVLKGQDKAISEISSLSLQNDKVPNDMVSSMSDEKEDSEVHVALFPSEDLQTTLEADDSKECFPMCAADRTADDLPLSLAHAGDDITKVPIDKERGHILSVLADVPATTSQAEHNSPSPSDGECISETDLSELSDVVHQFDHIEIEGNTQEIQNCDGLSMKNSSLEESSASDNASMSSLHEGIKSILDAEPVSQILEEYDMQHTSPELIREDIDNKRNVQPMDLDVDNVSTPSGSHDQAGPSMTSAGLEDLPKCSDDQFEQLCSELAASGESPLINVQNGIEDGKMERRDDVKEGMPLEEDLIRRPDNEEMGLDDEMMQSAVERTRCGDGKMVLSDDNADKEFDDEDQFVMGGPRHIPALVDFDDCSQCMLDNSEDHQSNSNIQDVDSNLEQKEQDYKTDGNMHDYPLESHSPKDQEACKEANSKLHQDKQGLQCPLKMAAVLQKGEISKPCWESSLVVEESRIHPLHDDVRRMQLSASQITDSGSAVQLITDPGRTQYCGQSSEVVNASECHGLHDDDRIQRLTAQSTNSGRQDRQSSSAISAEHDDPCSLIHADDLASVEDHELLQYSDHLCSPLVDLRAADYAKLHGHPTYLSTSIHVDPQQQIDQHVFNQPDTFHGPNVEKWDIDINTKRRHSGGSHVRKLVRRCLFCCKKPDTIP